MFTKNPKSFKIKTHVVSPFSSPRQTGFFLGFSMNDKYVKHINKRGRDNTWCGKKNESWNLSDAEEAANYSGHIKLCWSCVAEIEYKFNQNIDPEY